MMHASIRITERNVEANEATGVVRPSPLRNVGYSCFINSTLQALFAVPSVQRGLAMACLRDTPLSATLREALQDPRQAIEPVAFTTSDKFYEGSQEDAHEFLLKVLDTMDAKWIQDNLTWEECIQWACGSCKDRFEGRLESFRCVPLQIQNPDGTLLRSVEAALELYLGIEGGVQKCCDAVACAKVNRVFEKCVSPKRYPNVLVLHLKRWSPGRELLAHDVAVHNVLTIGDTTYDLCSIVLHKGPTPSDGHYTAATRYGASVQQDDMVRLYDDSRVSQRPLASCSGLPYLVCYERRAAEAISVGAVSLQAHAS